MRNLSALPVSTSLRNTGVREIKSAVRQRDRSQPHYQRKFYHMLNGLLCFSLYAFVLDQTQALITLAVVGGPLVILDLCRFRWPEVNAAALKLFGGIMRREELKSISGNSFYVVGLIVVTAIFPKPVALLGVLYLALGDPSAAIVGTLWGRHKWGNSRKSVEGSVANFLICALATLLVGMTYFQLPADRAVALAVIGGVVSMFAELLPLPCDDNFTIPVVSSSLLYLILSVVPIF